MFRWVPFYAHDVIMLRFGFFHFLVVMSGSSLIFFFNFVLLSYFFPFIGFKMLIYNFLVSK